eukprot:1078006-Alexandrium_andersonii.AAC.1
MPSAMAPASTVTTGAAPPHRARWPQRSFRGTGCKAPATGGSRPPASGPSSHWRGPSAGPCAPGPPVP